MRAVEEKEGARAQPGTFHPRAAMTAKRRSREGRRSQRRTGEGRHTRSREEKAENRSEETNKRLSTRRHFCCPLDSVGRPPTRDEVE